MVLNESCLPVHLIFNNVTLLLVLSRGWRNDLHPLEWELALWLALAKGMLWTLSNTRVQQLQLSLSLNPKTIYEEAQLSLLGNESPCREPRQHLAPNASQPHEWFLAGPVDKLSSCAQPEVLIHGLTRTIILVLF